MEYGADLGRACVAFGTQVFERACVGCGGGVEIFDVLGLALEREDGMIRH